MTSSFFTQIGSDIDGEAAYDGSGHSVSLSSDGSVVAIGAPSNDVNGDNSGHVRIYKNLNNTWIQVGSDIDGEAAYDRSGWSVSLSADGSVVAIGAPLHKFTESYSGHVRIYKNVNNTWTQIGSDIDGEERGDSSGYSVDLSADGSIVAIGARLNEGNGSYSGHVRIYRNVNNTWAQIGGDIDGESSNDQSGYSVSLSADGSVIAIGAPYNDDSGNNSGHVRIYKNVNNTWTQFGNDIDGDGEGYGDYSGHFVSLSADGSVVAIGAHHNDENGNNSGHVRIFKNVNNTWTKVGEDINGEAAYDQSGYSVSLSADGSLVAIGAPYNNVNGNYGGHVRIYKNVNNTWTLVGNDIDGEGYGDDSGASVSLSADGSVVAIGAPDNDGNGKWSGHVRIYNFDATPPSAPSFLITSETTTRDTTPTITGTAEAGSTVKLYNGETLIGSGTANSTGTFSITLRALNDGEYSLTATATDTAGNTSSLSSDLVISIYGNSPLISGPSGSSGDVISSISINENTRTIHNFSSDKSVTWSISGGIDQSLFSINRSNGNLSFNSSPNYESPSDSNADNRYIVDVKATDSSGNTSDQTVLISVNDVVDTIPVIPSSLSLKNKFGSSANDTITTNWNDLVWGLDGDDNFTLPKYPYNVIDFAGTLDISSISGFESEPFLIGGAGNDTYTVNKNQGALIYEAPNQGDNDRLVLNDLSLNSSDAYYMFIDYKHIAFFDTANNQFALVFNALDSLNYPYQSGIDLVQLDDGLHDANTLIRSLYRESYLYGGYLGSYSFSYMDQVLGGYFSQEGWTSSNINILISEIDNYGVNFIPDTEDIWNYLASNTDLIDVIGSDTNAAFNHYLSNGAKEKRVADNFDEWRYLASNPDLINIFGSDTNSATQHFVNSGYKEGRSKSTFNAVQYLKNNADLAQAFGSDLDAATKHYVEFGHSEGRTVSATGSGSGSGSASSSGNSSNLTDLEAYNYIASNPDLISAFGIDIAAAKSHYTNNGISEGRSLTSFSATDYLAKYSDLKAAFGNDETLALKHFIQSGYAEGRTASSTDSGSGSGSSSGGSSTLTDFQALNYIASYGDLINAFGTDLTSAKSHYTDYGKSEGRTLDDFDEWGYLASNNDLINSLGSDTTEAVKHYISFGYSQGKVANSFDPTAYLNNYADLRNAFGSDKELATKHFVEYGFNEGRVF